MDVTPQWRHRAFLCYVAVLLVIFLVPVPNPPLAESRYADKAVHFGMFLGFAVLFYADRHRGPVRTFLVSAVFAGGIELLQALLPYRGSDWLDFLAGSVGAAAGATLMVLSERYGRR